MSFEFSLMGVIFLIMLFVPNIIWTKNKPKDYEKYSNKENQKLQILERIGQVLVVCFSVFAFDFNLWPSNFVILIIAIILMVLYELYWIKYFKSNKTMADMYSSFLAIPFAGATLPVLSFLLLGIYQNNVFLIVSSIILAIGHIGIHVNHGKNFA